MARVDPHPRPQVGDLDALLLRELEQHAALGERVRRVEQTGPEQLQLGRVEAAEGRSSATASGIVDTVNELLAYVKYRSSFRASVRYSASPTSASNRNGSVWHGRAGLAPQPPQVRALGPRALVLGERGRTAARASGGSAVGGGGAQRRRRPWPVKRSG